MFSSSFHLRHLHDLNVKIEIAVSRRVFIIHVVEFESSKHIRDVLVLRYFHSSCCSVSFDFYIKLAVRGEVEQMAACDQICISGDHNVVNIYSYTER
jgi:hypothetical protein